MTQNVPGTGRDDDGTQDYSRTSGGSHRDDLESTADRRQGFLGMGGSSNAASPAAPAARTPDAGGYGSGSTAGSDGYRDTGRTDRSDDVVLDGATEAKPRGRGGAHVWSLILSLLLAPVAWYLLADAAARLLPDGARTSGAPSTAALLELACGLVVAAAVVLIARWSSLGAFVVGAIVLVAGIALAVVPGTAEDAGATFLDGLRSLGTTGENAADHLLADGRAGRLALYGLTLLLLGVVSHGARRQGRREERTRADYERRAGIR